MMRGAAFCSSVVRAPRPVQGMAGYIVFPECFVGQAGQPGGGPCAAFSSRRCRNMPGDEPSSDGGRVRPRVPGRNRCFTPFWPTMWKPESGPGRRTRMRPSWPTCAASTPGSTSKSCWGRRRAWGAAGKARTLRGPGAGVLLDGPFAETKEQLLGLYVVDCADEDAAIAVARDLRKVNPSAVYEIRAILTYIPGAAIPMTEGPDGSA